MIKALYTVFLVIPLLLSSCASTTTLVDPDAYFAAIIVDNMDISLDWYTQKLGFQLLNQTDNESYGFRQANIKRGHVLMELLEIKGSVSSSAIGEQFGTKARTQGFFKFGFIVKDFDQWIANMERAMVSFHGKVVDDPLSGKRMIIIKDPDGNRIQIFEK